MSRLLLSAGIFLLAVQPAKASDAPSTIGATSLVPPSRAEDVARCIVRTLPRGGQFYRAGDGSYRVVSFEPHDIMVEWTVRDGRNGAKVKRRGGNGEFDKSLKGTCYQ